jgi:acetolactate synthase regulatory subunit
MLATTAGAPAAPDRSGAAPAARPESATYCFSIQAAPEPGVMPRVLGLFAKRGLVPGKWYSVVTGAGALEIDIQVAGLASDAGCYLADCLRQLVSVRSVLMAVRRPD